MVDDLGVLDHIEGMLGDEQRWLSARREDYLKAVERLEDVDNVKALILGILDHLEPALGFNFAEQTDAEAFAVIAKQQCQFERLLTQMSLIEEYELRTQEADKLLGQIEAVKAGELEEADLAGDGLSG